MAFKIGQHVSIVPLTTGKVQLSYIEESSGLVTWTDEDFDSIEEITLQVDIWGLKPIPYIDLIEEARQPENWAIPHECMNDFMDRYGKYNKRCRSLLKH